MDESPASEKSKESTTFLMVVKKWKDDQEEQFSPVYRISGYPWRLRLVKGGHDKHTLSVVCEKADEAELWMCTAKVSARSGTDGRWSRSSHEEHTFASWDRASQECALSMRRLPVGTEVEVSIVARENGERWRRRPFFVRPLQPNDGVLVIGKVNRKEIPVNKELLASQSPFFDRFFNGEFKREEENEIPIGDGECEEFSTIIHMAYDFNGNSLTDENVQRMLQLADRFELKFVMEKVANFILSSSSSFSLCKKLLVSEQCNLPFLKDMLLSQSFTKEQLKELSNTPEWTQLSAEILRELYKKCTAFFH